MRFHLLTVHPIALKESSLLRILTDILQIVRITSKVGPTDYYRYFKPTDGVHYLAFSYISSWHSIMTYRMIPSKWKTATQRLYIASAFWRVRLTAVRKTVTSPRCGGSRPVPGVGGSRPIYLYMSRGPDLLTYAGDGPERWNNQTAWAGYCLDHLP